MCVTVVVVVVNEWISSDIGPLLRVHWTSSDEDFRQELRSCGNVEVAALGSPSLIVLIVSVDVKQHSKKLRSCVKVEVDVKGSPSLIVLNMVSLDVKQL